MNKMEKALRELTEMDDLAAGDSPVHGLSPFAKLITTVVYIVTVVSFDKYDLAGLAAMVIFPALLFSVSGISVRTALYKMRIVLPLVMAVGVLNPFFDRQVLLKLGGISLSGGVISMLTLMMKGVFCLMASFLMMATTKIEALCAALRKIHVPEMLVTLLLLTYRYVSVLTEELAVMTDAYHLRAPGQKGIHVSAWGSFLGQLLLRSRDRAEELYQSMLLRGFHGEFSYAETVRIRIRDLVYMAAGIGGCLLFRYGDVVTMLGRMVV